MNANDHDRLLAGWLNDEARSGQPITGLDLVLDQTRRRRPRPAWLAGPGSRWVDPVPAGAGSWPGASIARARVAWSTVLVLALLALALVGAAVFAAGQLRTRPGPLGEGGRLAYLANGGLYLADWDGRHPVLVDGPSLDPDTCSVGPGEGGLWSPDGRHLAIHAMDRGPDGCTETNSIHIRDAEGRAAASYPAGTGWRVAWAPDGSRLAAWESFGETIDIRALDGTLQSRLTMPPDRQLSGDWDPLWGPDGASLVVETLRLPIDGSEARQRVRDANGYVIPVSVPTMSANGDTVAFFDSTLSTAALYVAQTSDLQATRLDVGSERTIAMAMARQLLTSPAGDLVAVPTMRDAMFDEDGNLTKATWEVTLIDAASGEVRTLVTASGDRGIRPLGFSPDGRRVLYSMEDGDTPSLWSTDVDGSDSRLLVSGARWGAWQPAVR